MNAMYILFIIGCYLAERSGCRAVYISHSVTVFESLLLEGCDDKGARVEWKFNNNLLFLDDRLLFVTGLSNITLLPNNSVLIEQASIKHGGTYECISASKAIVSHDVNVEASPLVYITSSKMYTASGNHIFLQQNHLTTITCFANGSRPEVNLTLLVDDIVCGTSNITIIHGAGKNETFDTMVTVSIQAVNENGNISCQSNGVRNHSVDGLTLHYTSFVPPEMSLSKDGNEINDTVWLEENGTFYITCHALNSKPTVHLTWSSTLPKERNMTTWYSPTTESQLFNSTSAIAYTVGNSSDNLTCSAGFEDAELQWNTSVFVRSYVPPVMSFSKDGNEISGTIWLEENGTFYITCHALNSKPRTNLTWNLTLIEERNMTTWNSSTTGRQLFNSISTIAYKVGNSSDTLTCSAGFEDAELQWNTSVIVKSYERTNESSSTSNTVPVTLVSGETSPPSHWLQKQWVPPSIAAAVASFLAFCLYKAIKRAKASLTANIPTIDLSLGGKSSLRRGCQRREDALARHSKMPPEMSDIDSWKNATLPRTNESTLKRSFTGPPKLQLPKIPTDEEVSQYSAESENYYATTNETSSGGKMFGENDMCLILNLKMGEIYNRWMGTIAVSRESNRCVVFTTVTESQAMKKEIHWDAFVKRALEMPNTDHITSIEGIAIDKANFYLINEHLICETLESKVIGKSDPNAETSPFPSMMVSDIMKHASGIMSGMEVIHSYGFLHPGLSLKKVLLSNEGDCKLYDFCLSEDASEIVATKKMQVIASLNHFAPEALLRNEYNQGSDVWSIAVLMWEMMSVGNSPFLVDQELHTEEAIIGPGKPWPERYQQLQNKSLFECWNKDYSARPTVSNLKESFTKIFEALMENSFYEIPTSDLYAPMNAVTNFGGT